MSDRRVQFDPLNTRLLTTLKRSPAANWMAGLFAFLGLVSPTVINYTPCSLAWDEAYYLSRAICMNRAFYDRSLSRVTECLAGTHKGPIVELLGLPWGRAGGTEWGVGLAFVGLGLFIWIIVLATYLTCLHGGTSLVPLLLGAACIYLTPFLGKSGGVMMTDMLLAWCITLALMLIPIEYNNPQTEFWPSTFRGLLWGFVIDVGMLSKVTFLFFAGTIGLTLLIMRWRRSGVRPLLYTLAACALGAIPAILIWSLYGRTFVQFGKLVAWGDLAHLFSVPGVTAVGYLKGYVTELRWAFIPLLLLLGLFVRGLWIERQGRLVRLLPISVILIYLATAAMSQNRDPRFTIPVMIAMPLCLAWTDARTAPRIAMGPTPILAAFLVGTLCAIPMVGRPVIAPIQRSGKLLRTLSEGRSTTVMIATDGPLFNIESLQLARQTGANDLRPVFLDTLVYDEVNGRSLEEGLRRIDNADYVLFLRAKHQAGPDWSRTRAKDYRAHCEKVGLLLSAETSPDFDVFRIR